MTRKITVKEVNELEEDIRRELGGLYSTHLINPSEIEMSEMLDNIRWVMHQINDHIYDFLIKERKECK